jgi:chemotaxis protein CheD
MEVPQKSDTFFLYPSNLYVTGKNCYISTILGSCVSVCLFDAGTGICGMNHYMLPLWNGQGLASPKYGNIAIAKLIEKMENAGAQPKRLAAKVFGGGEVLDNAAGGFRIGPRNAEIALQTLENLKIPVKAKHLGGTLGRRIIFDTASYEVKMRLIEKMQYETGIKA